MNWHDKQIWKHSFISANVGLLGCIIGTLGLLYVFSKHSWIYLFLSSFVLGLFCCVVMVSMLNAFHKESGFKKPLNISLTTSTIALLSMMFVENTIIVLSHPHHHALTFHTNQQWDLGIALMITYIISIALNYYLMQKPRSLEQKLLR
ncbi:MAG: hypothetical protein RL060_262 [Bacteroidota bacterium]